MVGREQARLHTVHIRIDDENRVVPQSRARNFLQSFRGDRARQSVDEGCEKGGTTSGATEERHDSALVAPSRRVQCVIK